MKRAMFLVVAVGAACGLAACGGGSSGGSASPSDAMATFTSAVQSGDRLAVPAPWTSPANSQLL